MKTKQPILAKALLIDYRTVKSSMGEKTQRPVINTIIRVGSEEYTIELTLVNRSLMGYRMLLGRQALKKDS
ncbi:MAG: RimK/LysX family protein [Bdellovibrionota bacterium]